MSERGRQHSRLPEGVSPERIPPGQVVAKKLPVLHYGPVPAIDLSTWDLRVFGLVEEPLRYSYDDILAMPRCRTVADVHCVTRWTLLDTIWEGVKFADLMRGIRAHPEGRFVMVHAEGGYTTNLPLDVLMGDDVLLAYRYGDAELTPEHGWPLRLVVPQKYFWKSAKWIRGLEFMAQDKLGFWERSGYNNHADPWKEERYA